jgi:N-acetylglucosamine malate deacetylase 1
MIKRILFVAPHPDDEVLGCGGIIKKYSQSGHPVFVLIMTRGKKELYSEAKIKNIRAEALKAHKLLGVNDTVFLNFPAPDLDLISTARLSMEILKVVIRFEINTIFLPHRGDIHHDHRAVFNAGLVASRPSQGNRITNVFSYETLSESEWAAPFSDDAFIPDLFMNISLTFNTKLEALKCFKSQVRAFPHPRSLKAVEALARYRGSTVGFEYAEAFMTIRIIED